MKTLLEILGFSSLDEKEKKVLQRLRDEAIEEKANDELNDSVGKGIHQAMGWVCWLLFLLVLLGWQ